MGKGFKRMYNRITVAQIEHQLNSLAYIIDGLTLLHRNAEEQQANIEPQEVIAMLEYASAANNCAFDHLACMSYFANE